MPSVQEVAAAGFPHETWGEAPRTFVVLKAAAASEAELKQFCRALFCANPYNSWAMMQDRDE
jgi:acyl-CoA synthetase (AMP-forming)/AMP-acid ligase II